MQTDGIMPTVCGISAGVGSVLCSSCLEGERLRRSRVDLVTAYFPLERNFGRAIGCDRAAEHNWIGSAAHAKADICIHGHVGHNGGWRRNDGQVT